MKGNVVKLICFLTSTVIVPPASAEVLTSRSFDFATERTASWSLTATTKLNRADPPAIDHISCLGQNEQFGFSMNGSGALEWLNIKFLSNPEEDGDRSQITLLGDHLWLYVDGERWEYANIPFSSLLKNFKYSQPDGDIILMWRGHPAVRKGDSHPWLHLSRIYELLIAAQKIEWSYKSRDWTVVDKTVRDNQLPEGWQTTRYAIDNRGLEESVSWCAKQVSSDAAYTLPDPFRSEIRE